MNKTRLGSRTYFWQYNALVCIRRVSLQRISSRLHTQHIMGDIAHIFVS
ncbi:MAG: hypothetical protein ACMUEL_04645 [Flavobacteriales bacterium Tduv]